MSLCISFFHLFKLSKLLEFRNSAAIELGVEVGVLSRLLYDVCYILHIINNSAGDPGINPPVAASIVGKGNYLSYYILGLCLGLNLFRSTT